MVTGVGKKEGHHEDQETPLWYSMLNYVYIYNFIILEYTGDKCYSGVVVMCEIPGSCVIDKAILQ
jgi:hypothetical protein